ncbi:hypothetical protein H0A36_09810 [Endozoicomonas sp. SM1973]|uniref:Uncharacterized protein n=1 Tax=Spartinivicinus marinus TaxID=2994442 RepID=A0A853IAN4_9GAMM|nr:hypothetical protein [Spartinivicinus marinus]MCX4024668.1 hypothetical protein [Spartinivicinus marinus]NYZ66305.1 hypothetical protein [Spartinivicinus marinus]
MSSVNAVSSPNAAIGLGMGIDAMAMLVMMEQANNIQARIQDQFAEIQQRNNLLKDANQWLQQARVLQNQAGDDGSSNMPPAMAEWFKSHGVEYDKTGGDLIHNKDEWSINIENLKTKIDEFSSQNQLETTRLQSLLTKFNQSFELASNTVKKDGESKSTVARNV